MRCTQCEWPLSPSRNRCPRCGTIVNTKMSNAARGELPPPSVNPFASGNQPSDPISSRQPYANINQNIVNNFENPNSQNIPQMPFFTQQPAQIPFSPTENWSNVPPSEPQQQANIPPNWIPTSQQTNRPQNKPSQPPVHKPSRPSPQNRSKTTQIGFTVAALCIIAGSFLLVFVFLLGQGFLPIGNTSSPSSNVQSSKTVTPDQTASATQVPTPTVLPATPTPTLSGQALLDTAVLASQFNEQTGQIIQESTTFTVGQKIYLVLSLHPGGNIHTVCLNWYLNTQLVYPYDSSVDPTSNYKYYYYEAMNTTGNGYVDISLASTTTCTNAVLARQLDFTIS